MKTKLFLRNVKEGNIDMHGNPIKQYDDHLKMSYTIALLPCKVCNNLLYTPGYEKGDESIVHLSCLGEAIRKEKDLLKRLKNKSKKELIKFIISQKHYYEGDK